MLKRFQEWNCILGYLMSLALLHWAETPLDEIQLFPVAPDALPITLNLFRISNAAYDYQENFQAVVAPARVWEMLV